MMDVIIAINSRYYQHCRTMLLSMFQTNSTEPISVHLLYSGLTDRYIRGLNKLVAEHGGNLYSYQVDNTIITAHMSDDRVHRQQNNRYSIEMYYRILSYRILPSTISRALWLDSDIIVNGSLSEFYHQSFDEMDIVACRDPGDGGWVINQIKKNMELPEDHQYFNSGVILFNLEKIREEIKERMISNLIRKYQDRLTFPDQDLLNKLFQNRVKYADASEYNNQFCVLGNGSVSEARIIHFATQDKPWNPLRATPYYYYYWDIRKIGGVCGRYARLRFLFTYHLLKSVHAYEHCKKLAAFIRNR